MEKENILLVIKKYMMVIGLIIKWKEKELFCGQMEENMKGNLKMIKKMDMENLLQMMELNIKGNGKMEK